MRTALGSLLVLLALGRSAAGEPAIEQLRRAADAGPAASGDVLAPAEQARLAADRQDPAISRYLELVAALRRSEHAPFGLERMRKAQLDVAERLGLNVEAASDVLIVSSTGDHWLNRLAAGMDADMAGGILWSPLSLHAKGAAGAYGNGALWLDDIAPLLTGPTPEFFHEYVHAYVDRGRHRDAMLPLAITFLSEHGDFPQTGRYPHARYPDRFGADELLAWLNTIYKNAKSISEYGRGTAAPSEVGALADLIDTPRHIAEVMGAAAARLRPGVAALAANGLGGAVLEKRFGRPNGSIAFVGEVEKNRRKDRGFFTGDFQAGGDDVTARFYTVAFLREDAPDGREFPVLFERDRVAARIALPLAGVDGAPLADAAVQDRIIRQAASRMADGLGRLEGLVERLQPSLDRLGRLQRRARKDSSAAAVAEIEKESKAAFLQAIRFFVSPAGDRS